MKTSNLKPIAYNWAFIFLIYLLSSCNQPKEFPITITGQAAINETIVRLTDLDSKIVYDSTIVKNNQFTLHTNKINTGFYYIDFKNSTPIDSVTSGWVHWVGIYIEEGKQYSFYAKDKDSICNNNYTIRSNSNDQNKLNEYKKLSKNTYDSLKQVRDRLLVAKDLTQYKEPFYGIYSDSISLIDDQMGQSLTTSAHKFIRDNNNTILIPYLINQMSDLFDNYSLYKTALDKLNDDYKFKPETKKAFKNIEAASKLHLGAILPEIAGKDTSGQSYDYDFSNKKLVLVDFWASWCTPCRQENPRFKRVYKKYKDQGFDIISVSMDQNIQKWKSAINEDGLTWTNISEGVRPSKSINYERFNTKYLPLNYLVNNEGKIIARNLDAYSIEKMFEN